MQLNYCDYEWDSLHTQRAHSALHKKARTMKSSRRAESFGDWRERGEYSRIIPSDYPQRREREWRVKAGGIEIKFWEFRIVLPWCDPTILLFCPSQRFCYTCVTKVQTPTVNILLFMSMYNFSANNIVALFIADTRHGFSILGMGTDMLICCRFHFWISLSYVKGVLERCPFCNRTSLHCASVGKQPILA